MMFRAFLLLPLLLATANIEFGESPQARSESFGRIIAHTGERLQSVAHRRPLRLKAMNDSLAATAAAAAEMASGKRNEVITRRLDEAIRRYPDNSFAYLLRGILANATGDIPESNRWMEAFLIRSRTYTEFDKAFIPWDSFQKLRRIVYELLGSRGVRFEGREKEIQIRIPFEALKSYVLDPEGSDRFWNVFFIAALFVGTFLLFGSALFGISFGGFWMASLLYFYIVSWLAYGLWFADLAIGLPYGLSRFTLVPGIVAGFVLLRLLYGAALWHSHRTRKPEKGFRKCPACEAEISSLIIECPVCRRKIG